MKKRETNYSIWYDGLEYKGHKEDFDYSVTFDDLMSAIRKYFDNQLVTLDGTDTSVWNAFIDLGEEVIDVIFDTMEDWLKEQCKEKAQEEFEEYIDWYYDEED